MSQKPCHNCQQPIHGNAQFCPFCGQQQATAALTGRLPANTMLDNRYIIDTLVGKGGMGAVYRAVDTRIGGRVCAVKEMSVMGLPSHERGQAIQNFQREAQLLANLQHPNLPKVHDFFQDGSSGRHYLVMDFVQGETLDELLERQKGPFSEQQVRAWGRQLCDVLQYLHSQNPPVIFRDLKPHNIMVDQSGQLKLIDFGIARFFKSAQVRDTQAMGTVGYVPPEQHGKGQTDARSDIYSLGATLWRLLTAQDPANDPYRLPGVRQHNRAVSAELERVIQRAMELKSEDRFQTTAEFRNALQGQAIGPGPVKPPIKLWSIAVLLLILVVGGGLGMALLNNTPPTPIPTQTSTSASPSIIIVEATLTETAVAPATSTATLSPSDTPVNERPTQTPTAMAPTPTMTPAPSPTTGLANRLIGNDGVEMLLVPAGDFIMGSTSSDVDLAVSLCRQSGNSCPRNYFTNEMPRRTVYVSNFYMDATEITNDQYRACVNARVCTPPSDSGAPDARYQVSNYYNLSRYGNYPVVRIRWEDAQTYCQWVGRRLPTEAEWEKAARGTDGRLFPWGNSFDSRRANTEDGGGDRSKPVASYPDGRSPYGIYDMAGNVWEYVADWYSDAYYENAPNRDPQGPTSGSARVLRGGSYSDFQEYARVTNRGTPHAGSIRSGFRGFRCAQSAD